MFPSRKFMRTSIFLISGYIALQMIADIGATKMVHIWGQVIPGGTFVFALTFTWRDALHKRLGREWARNTIIAAGVINLFMAGYLAWVAGLPDLGDAAASAWPVVFAFVPSIVIGSILAEVISELIDTEIYHLLAPKTTGRWQFLRVLGSNAVSLPLDSIIFAVAAFALLPRLFGADPLPWSVLPSIMLGQIVFKAIVTAISLPMIYLVREKDQRDANYEDTANDAASFDADSGFGHLNIGDEL